ncbi:hypothetical protein AYK26_01590 [Euryarchaeota archaeon SM23-78]|nr:MAG: hypothetical protein AYK26_01590 [Euryarchaeota archaeon SM23-78]MBW3000440.1 hypothetical protein [Candidatus Woesearchaeota archaeon]
MNKQELEKLKEYIHNLPFSEKLVRDFIEALQGSGHGKWYENNFDAQTIPLEEILSVPNSPVGGYGLRIYQITEGPGKHIVTDSPYSSKISLEVPKNKIYVTFDNFMDLSGVLATYIYKRDKQNKFERIDEIVHSVA